VFGVFSILVFHRQMTAPPSPEASAAMTPETAAALSQLSVATLLDRPDASQEVDGTKVLSVEQESTGMDLNLSPAAPQDGEERSVQA
jgi:hypothetical protein